MLQKRKFNLCLYFKYILHQYVCILGCRVWEIVEIGVIIVLYKPLIKNTYQSLSKLDCSSFRYTSEYEVYGMVW